MKMKLGSLHQRMHLDESFSFMIFNQLYPSWCLGKLFFVCPFLMANLAVLSSTDSGRHPADCTRDEVGKLEKIL